ncbi:MAG TPA: hypothetical protein VNU25_02770 [Candidatus Paceibacterota bacterium]|nr:hypothetical protein [Candidatus Paceibacterota bacterium]
MNTPEPGVVIKVKDLKESARRIPDPDKPDPVHGKFWFTIDITALAQDVYVPLSVASGKKPAGFMYQIEGTAPGAIKSTDISSKGDGILQVTHGTILYAKIPAGKTATFKLRIEMRGALNKTYGITLYQIQYKWSPTDARYQKLAQAIRSKMEKFK